MRRILAASFAVLSLSLVMGACSSDSKKVADVVQNDLKKQSGVDVKTTCDSSLEAKKGSKGTCTATGSFPDTFLQSLGLPAGTGITELKLNIEFISDTTFNPTLDVADLQSKLGSGTATSPSDASTSDSASIETESSSS